MRQVATPVAAIETLVGNGIHRQYVYYDYEVEGYVFRKLRPDQSARPSIGAEPFLGSTLSPT